MEDANVSAYSLAEMDFLTAERQARAKINIVKLCKNDSYSSKYVDPFDLWFENTFGFKAEKNKEKYIWEKQETVKNKLVTCDNKIEMLVNLYNDEMKRLYESFGAICKLDKETLADIGVDTQKVKESLKFKIENAKILYWRLVFDYLDDITKRLTAKSRDELFHKFERLNEVDFNESNIRSVVIWVMKNASSLSNNQLVNLYKDFTTPDNIIKYKSNQRVFIRDRWSNTRFDDKDKVSHYCLSYRLVVDCLLFREYLYSYNGYKLDDRRAQTIVNDLAAIAFNLGFDIESKDSPESFGEKYYIYGKDRRKLIEFKLYKNGNTHIKLDIELAKAINVEVSRLLGWIRDKSDIAKEFPDEMAEGAEKYFNVSRLNAINFNNVKLLGNK